MGAGALVAGRNVGHEPMPEESWHALVTNLAQLVDKHGGTVHTVAFGTGAWHGTPEETAVLTFDGVQVPGFLAELSWYATLYGQDAIAVTIGANVLVYRQSDPLAARSA